MPDLAMTSSSGDGGATAAGFSDALLTAHNTARMNAMPAPMPPLSPLTWNQSAADTAAAWAAQCNFSHNPNRGNFGENIFAGSGSAYTPDAVVQAWISEAANYDYATNGCTSVCGHYTQVVWRQTTSVGCARQHCTTASALGNDWDFWVCDYSPPGNFVGQKPY